MLTAAVWPAAVFADDEPTIAATTFFGTMRGGIEDPKAVSNLALPHDDYGVLSGYYRIRVAVEGSPPPVLVRSNACRNALDARTPGITDWLFKRSYDMGVKSMIALDLAEDGNPPVDDKTLNRSEVALFQLRKSGRSDCAPSLTYFASYPSYVTPWRPIVAPEGSARYAWVGFKPWAVSTANPEMLSNFWTGILGAASLIGPVGTLANAFFGGTTPGAGQNENRAIAHSALHLGDVSGTLPLVSKRLLVTNGKNPMKRQQIVYNVRLGPDAAPLFATVYRLSVEYRASILGNEDENFHKLTEAEWSNLAVMSPPANAEMAAAITNLRKQQSVATFASACDPVLRTMAASGYSTEDQAAIVYGAGHARFTDADLVQAECLNDISMRRPLERLGVTTLPLALKESQDGQIGTLNRALIDTVTAPAMSIATLAPHFDSKIWVAGDLSLLGFAGTAGVSSSAAQKTQAELVQAMTAMPARVTNFACSASSNAKKGELQFPDGSGLRLGNDGIIAMTIKNPDNSTYLLIAGLKGATDATGSIIDRLWAGTAGQATGKATADLNNRLLSAVACRSALNLPPSA